MSPADKWTLLTSAAWMPLFSLGLHALGLSRFHAWVKRTRLPGNASMTQQEIKTFAHWVNVAARRSPFRAACLTRSLLLEWLLRRRGVPGQLRIGVRLDGAALDAHAWVEVEGVPVNDKPDIAQHFAPFDDLATATLFRAR